MPLFRRAKDIDERAEDQVGLTVGLSNLSDAQRLSGDLHGAEASARSALVIDREWDDQLRVAICLYMIGLALSARGKEDAEVALERSLRMFIHQDAHQSEGLVNAYLADHAIRLNTLPKAQSHADRAWERASVWRHERDFICAARVQGVAALEAGDVTTARERLEHALTRARAVNLAEEELPTLVALAELHRREGHSAQAREHLEDVWESAERGPYPLSHADALNVLAQIERDQDNTDAAIKAATEAYTHAWCNGPPFAYHWGLENAREHLAALGTTEPQLEPFDASRYDPMPDVEINPADEFAGD